MGSSGIWDETLECMDWSDLRTQQLQQIPSYVARLKAESGMYKYVLQDYDPDSITSFEALADLPFTEKSDLRKGQAGDTELILGTQQAVANSDLVSVLSSSGTTGQPVFFGLTRKDVAAWNNSIAAMFSTAGIDSNSIAALSTGMPILAGGVPYFEAIREIGATSVWFGGQTTQRMASTLQKLQVNTLVSTASFATYFAGRAEELLQRSASSLGIRTVVAGGEPGMGNPTIRERVRDLWGAERVSEVMGLGDVLPGIWGECAQGEGMHFTATRDVLVELIEPESGDPVQWVEGATGELVYTTFTREATPVLRFRSRDHVMVEGTQCDCGRATPRIRCIGRTDDMLIYKGMNVFPSAIRDVALSVAHGKISDIMRVRKESQNQVQFLTPLPLEIQVLGSAVNVSELSQEMEELKHRIEARVLDSLRIQVNVELYNEASFNTGDYKNALSYVPSEPTQTT